MATMLGALTIQREFASLLTTFRPDRLAERVFNLMTALKRLLAQHRLVRAERGQSSDSLKEDLTKLRADNLPIRREWLAMTEYWKGELARAEGDKAAMKQQFTSSFQRQEEDHQHLQNGYVNELNQMREELKDTQAQCEIGESFASNRRGHGRSPTSWRQNPMSP
jgi:septin family protein